MTDKNLLRGKIFASEASLRPSDKRSRRNSKKKFHNNSDISSSDSNLERDLSLSE